MSRNELPTKVISRERPRKVRWPVASVKCPPEDLILIDAAAGVLSQRESERRGSDVKVTRSDVVYSGTMKFVREVLGIAA